MEFEAKAKKWGSSIGVVLPKEIVDKIGIKPNTTLKLDIKTFPKAREFFGILPRTSKKTAQQIKDEIRQGW